MKETFQAFERVYLAEKRYPKFFEYSEENMQKMFKLFDTGYCYPLPGRDDEGRKIILMRTGKLDYDVFSTHDSVRLLIYVITALLEEEETQIAGIMLIFDHANSTIRHAISPVDLLDLMDFSKKCSAVRQKGTIVMNLPSFGVVLLELFRSVLSEKMKKRLVVLKNSDDLKNHVNLSMLPKEYGGTTSEAEILESFLQFRESKRANLQMLLDAKIDWDNVNHDKVWSNHDDEGIGSFRKLEID